MTPTLEEIRFAVDAAAGRRPGTLLLRRANLLNVFSGERYQTDILLAGRLVAALGEGYRAETEIDLDGQTVAPGLIDGHLHLESALVEPREYARAVVPRGVTAVVADPHEIANVLGVPGVSYILKATEGLPLDVFVTASSCVPATHLETAGARLGLTEIDELLRHPRVVGVAELMNFPGIVEGDETELGKALLAERHGKVADGHSPLLRGRGLNAYLAAGISSDHESSDPEEALEKLRLGCRLMIREGSAARNLAALLPLVTPANAHQVSFVTDDRDPADLLKDGGVDLLVRRAIAAGMDPTLAVRLGSLNTARHYRLARRGAVGPGYLADLAVLGDLGAYRADLVIKSGQVVARDGRLLADLPRYTDPSVLNTVHLPDLTPERLAVPNYGRAIELIPGEIITRDVAVTGSEEDLAKLVVIERHGRSGTIGVGWVLGFGLRRGAIASTVAHDSHNLIIAGADDTSILAAARAIAEMRGGFVAVDGDAVLARLPLPIAGLISPEPLEAVRDSLVALEHAAAALGVYIRSPFMALSFLALPVIPELKLSDLGLIRVGPAGLGLVPLRREENPCDV